MYTHLGSEPTVLLRFTWINALLLLVIDILILHRFIIIILSLASSYSPLLRFIQSRKIIWKRMIKRYTKGPRRSLAFLKVQVLTFSLSFNVWNTCFTELFVVFSILSSTIHVFLTYIILPENVLLYHIVIYILNSKC